MNSATQSTIALYYWPTPNGWKISIMLEELGAPYAVHYVDINKGEQFDTDFLAIAPNNRMPAIIDPGGPGGKPVSVFESGAILMYLGRKFGRFYPLDDERARIETEEWLMWQMGNVGPMLGQNHHFRRYAPEKLPYAIARYEDEAHRLYGVLDKRLAGRDFVAGDYSIADMAIIGWMRSPERQGIDIGEFLNVKAWRERLLARPAVERAIALGFEKRSNIADDAKAKSVLFGQRATA
jgi:GST-like protein